MDSAVLQLEQDVRRSPDVPVMRDRDYGVPGFDQLLECSDEELEIGWMEPAIRFVEKKHGGRGVGRSEKSRQFDALGLAATELVRGLPEGYVAEAEFVHRAAEAFDRRIVREEQHGFANGEREYVRDRLAMETRFQDVRRVASPPTLGTWHLRVFEKVESDPDHS